MNKELLEKYVADGLSINDICGKTNKGNTCVRYWLRKYGLKTDWKGKLEKKTTDKNLLKIANNSNSFTDCLLTVCGNCGGGAYYFYKQRLEKLGFDFSTFKNDNGIPKFLVKSNQQAVGRKDRRVKRRKLQIFLEYNGIPYKCNSCGINKWIGKKLLLHVHHKDENPYNNVLENLCYLCPNCHGICHYDNEGKLANKLI